MTSQTAPTIEEATMAAQALSPFDPGRVLLYGSVAKGTATADSDIDLCMILDDLDYTKRWDIHIDGLRKIREAVDREVNLHTTDRPEWRALTQCVSTFERHISEYAVVLHERPERDVEWDKEMLQPTTDEALAVSDLFRMERMVERMYRKADQPSHSDALVEVCAAAHHCLAVSLESIKHALPCPHIPKMTTQIHESIQALPLDGSTQRKLTDCLAEFSSAEIASWREAALGGVELYYKPTTEGYALRFRAAAHGFAQVTVEAVEVLIGASAVSSMLRETLERYVGVTAV